MLITDTQLFATLERIEGVSWASIDRRGGPHTLTTLLEVRAEYERRKEEWQLGAFDAEMAALFDHSGVVYGEGGWSRYVLRGEELVLEGASTHEAKRVKAQAEGIRILG